MEVEPLSLPSLNRISRCRAGAKATRGEGHSPEITPARGGGDRPTFARVSVYIYAFFRCGFALLSATFACFTYVSYLGQAVATFASQPGLACNCGFAATNGVGFAPNNHNDMSVW